MGRWGRRRGVDGLKVWSEERGGVDGKREDVHVEKEKGTGFMEQICDTFR